MRHNAGHSNVCLQTTKANAIIQVHRLRVYVFTILRLLMAQIERL